MANLNARIGNYQQEIVFDRIIVRLQAKAEELRRFQVPLLYIQSTSFTCSAKPWSNNSHKQPPQPRSTEGNKRKVIVVIKVENVTKGSRKKGKIIMQKSYKVNFTWKKKKKKTAMNRTWPFSGLVAFKIPWVRGSKKSRSNTWPIIGELSDDALWDFFSKQFF